MDKNKKYSFIYSVDLRAIGAFRIVLSISLIIDFLLYRLPAFSVLFSEGGMMSSETAALYPDASSISLLYYITSPFLVGLFFVIYFLLCVALLVGYKTKATSIIAYVFLYSIHQRVAPFLYGGDDVLRVALFWSMFLPLDSKFSLFNNKEKKSGLQYGDLSVFALLLQISIIYFFNALLKNGEMWANGTAVAFAASIFEHQAKYSYLLIESPLFSKTLTYLTMVFEFSIPFLIFSPFANNKTRAVASLSIVVFHFGLIPFLDVNTFYLSTLPFAVVLLPPKLWDRAEKLF